MKKHTLTLLSLGLCAGLFAQTESYDTVSLGAGYANQKWYSLLNDEQGTQPKDNWDLGFEISGFSASVIANTQKSNFMVYKAPYGIGSFNTLDTAGIASWPVLYNSDTTWSTGALNRGIDPANGFDLGWGVYDMGTHFVNGDSCFVVKLSATSWKKLKIDNLGNGIYNFAYANIDGSDPHTYALAKATYPGKNFGYYDMTSNTELDREPATADWDLTFVKYTTFIPTAYGVTGVLSNKGVKVAEADNVPSVATYTDYSAAGFHTEMNGIGYDWKTFNMSTGVYDVSADTCYFVQTADGSIWKLRFTGFGGSATGDIMFAKEQLATAGISDPAGHVISEFSLYPNPASGDALNILFASAKDLRNVTLRITDMSGKTIFSETIGLSEGFNKHTVPVNGLAGGIYMMQLSAPGFSSVQKFVKY